MNDLASYVRGGEREQFLPDVMIGGIFNTETDLQKMRKYRMQHFKF